MKNTIKLLSGTLILVVAYIIEMMLLSGILIAIGLHFPELKVSQQVSFIQLILSGLIGSAFTLYLITKYSMSRWSVFLILSFVLFFSNISVAIEGSIFTPDYVTGSVLVSLFIQQLLISTVFSFAAVLLFRKNFLHQQQNQLQKSISRWQLKSWSVQQFIWLAIMCGAG